MVREFPKLSLVLWGLTVIDGRSLGKACHFRCSRGGVTYGRAEPTGRRQIAVPCFTDEVDHATKSRLVATSADRARFRLPDPPTTLQSFA